jgi:hypothetical protein
MECSLKLIIEIPEGEWHTNQTGGYACHHRDARGTELVIDSPASEHFLMSYFTGEKHRGWCSTYGDGTGGIDEDTCHTLDALLDTLGWLRKIDPGWRVDRRRVRSSEEAWVYLIHNNNLTGVLVWENSD